MIEKIIIAHLYNPGSAATNRIIAYSKSFKELGKETTLVLGCDKTIPLPKLEGVNVVGITALTHSLLWLKMAKEIKKYYTNESAILVYGSPLLCMFLPKSKYNIFYECTEIPFYGKSKGLMNRLKEGVKRVLSQRATGMMVISEALKEYFISQGIQNITVVNMFVDAARFDIGCPVKKCKYIAYCGTVSPYKDGADILINAFAIFHKMHPDYSLKIIGKFENEESEKEVRSLAVELGIKENIDFTGMVLPDEMPQLLTGASMLALARPNNRQAQFGFPTKLGEYLATKNPVVVTNVGEIGLFLKDGVNCRMAEPDNPHDFAEKMSWVADHEEEAKLLGEQGRLLTQKEFSALEQSKRAFAFMSTIL